MPQASQPPFQYMLKNPVITKKTPTFGETILGVGNDAANVVIGSTINTLDAAYKAGQQAGRAAYNAGSSVRTLADNVADTVFPRASAAVPPQSPDLLGTAYRTGKIFTREILPMGVGTAISVPVTPVTITRSKSPAPVITPTKYNPTPPNPYTGGAPGQTGYYGQPTQTGYSSSSLAGGYGYPLYGPNPNDPRNFIVIGHAYVDGDGRETRKYFRKPKMNVRKTKSRKTITKTKGRKTSSKKTRSKKK